MTLVRQLLALVVVVLAIACGGARSGGVGAVVNKSFSASSLGGSQGIQARLDGVLGLGDRWVFVTVPRGAVRTYQLDRQDYWDLRIRVGVATCRGRNADVVSEGRAVRLAPLLGLSRDAARLDTALRTFRDTLRLDAGVPPGTDLSQSWVAFIFEWPFESVLATYTLHTSVPLDASGSWTGRQADLPGERCR